MGEQRTRESGAVPPEIITETIYVVEADFAPDAGERRKPYRREHLLRVAELRRQGTFLEAGAYTDGLTTSLILVRAADAEAAIEVARQDVYVRTGVWTDLRVRPFGRVVGLAQPE